MAVDVRRFEDMAGRARAYGTELCQEQLTAADGSREVLVYMGPEFDRHAIEHGYRFSFRVPAVFQNEVDYLCAAWQAAAMVEEASERVAEEQEAEVSRLESEVEDLEDDLERRDRELDELTDELEDLRGEVERLRMMSTGEGS